MAAVGPCFTSDWIEAATRKLFGPIFYVWATKKQKKTNLEPAKMESLIVFQEYT